jgi:hypothetical protein
VCLKWYNTEVRTKDHNVNMHEGKEPFPSSNRREKRKFMRAEFKYHLKRGFEARHEKMACRDIKREWWMIRVRRANDWIVYRISYVVHVCKMSKEWNRNDGEKRIHFYQWRDRSRKLSQESQRFILFLLGRNMKYCFYLCERKRKVSRVLTQKRTAVFIIEKRGRWLT